MSNREDVYDNQISPLMTEIIRICKEHDIPMVASFQYDDRESDGAALCTTVILNQDPKPCEGLLNASRALLARKSSMTMLTVRDGDGDVVSMEAIVT